MVKLADLVTKITIERTTAKPKVIRNPEWWAVHHRVKKELKNKIMVEDIAKSARFNTSYQVVTLERQPSMDLYVKNMQAQLDWKQYTTFAPWNPIFNKSKTIIVFPNKPKTP